MNNLLHLLEEFPHTYRIKDLFQLNIKNSYLVFVYFVILFFSVLKCVVCVHEYVCYSIGICMTCM